jgi:hypothetical protein
MDANMNWADFAPQFQEAILCDLSQMAEGYVGQRATAANCIVPLPNNLERMILMEDAILISIQTLAGVASLPTEGEGSWENIELVRKEMIWRHLLCNAQVLIDHADTYFSEGFPAMAFRHHMTGEAANAAAAFLGYVAPAPKLAGPDTKDIVAAAKGGVWDIIRAAGSLVANYTEPKGFLDPEHILDPGGEISKKDVGKKVDGKKNPKGKKKA